MHLADATWTEVDELDTDLVILPVGSTEQHGPHATLATDWLNAQAVADAGADAYDGEVVVAPPVTVGVAEEHRAFTGTMWVSPDTFRDYVREAAASLAHHGFDRVVFVNGHGGNVDALGEVAARLSRDGTCHAVAFTWFDAVDAADAAADAGLEETVQMGHGGALETALLRAANPDAVREANVDDARDGASDRWGEWVSGVNLAHDSDEFTENGVVGDPGQGTEELGNGLLDQASERLANLLEAVAER